MNTRKLGTGLILAVLFILPLTLYFVFRSISSPQFKDIPYAYRANAVGDTVKCGISDFAFIDQDGNTFTNEDMADKVYLVDFFSPADSLKSKVLHGNLKYIYDNADSTAFFEMLSIHTGDSMIADMQNYAATHEEINKQKWRFVAGTQKEVLSLAKSLGIPELSNQPEGSQHFTAQSVVMVDKRGYVRGYYDKRKDKHTYFAGTDLASVRKITESLLALILLEYPEEANREK